VSLFTSICQIPELVPRLHQIPCLFTSICQIPELVPRLHQIPCNHYFPRWYNPNMRFKYHGGDFRLFSWTIARIESGSWWARDEYILWRRVSLAILSPEHLQNEMWSKMLGKTQILQEKLIQEWRWIVNHIVMEFCILFWDQISSFNETCLVFISLLFWNQQMFNILFWQNILIKLQHVRKVNQS